MKEEHITATVQAIDFMKRHLHREITTEELAQYTGYSTFHFTRIFKEITGVSPRHYLSALRVEEGKRMLMNTSSSILRTLLSIGFRSFGTFSSKFKQFVGISPNQFRTTTKELHQFVNNFKEMKEELHTSSTVTCHIEFPQHFKGIIFIGFFPRPIPDQRPVSGTALTHTKSSCVFNDLPEGTYYLMAAAVPYSQNPKKYFMLEHSLRGKVDDPVIIIKESNLQLNIHLRDPLPYDPPILINLPQLLFEKVKNKAK